MPLPFRSVYGGDIACGSRGVRGGPKRYLWACIHEPAGKVGVDVRQRIRGCITVCFWRRNRGIRAIFYVSTRHVRSVRSKKTLIPFCLLRSSVLFLHDGYCTRREEKVCLIMEGEWPIGAFN